MMDAMPERPVISPTRRSRRRSVTAFVATGALVLTGCGGADREPTALAASPSTVAAITAASTPPTVGPASRPPTTTITTTTTTTTTTAATTTTTTTTTTPTRSARPITTSPPATTTTLVVEAPPQPIAPPSDEYSEEPVIEVGSIEIPKLDVDMTMYEGIRLTTLDYGPGHWPGTALPGQHGNVVVGGHRTSSHRVFRNVDQLTAGDEIIFRDETGAHTYLVNRVEVVEPTAMWIVDPTETATATLFACHPPGSTTQRIVVFADLAESITS